MTAFRSSNLSSDIRKYRPSISYHAAPAGRRNKMLEWRLATLNASSPIMSHAFVKTNIKALRFLLAWLLCFYMENPMIFFWKAIFATSPIVPAVTIHNLPWKMRVETCPSSFQYGILPSSLCLEARSLCVVCGLLAMLRKKLEVTAFRSFKTLRKHPYNSYH